MLRLKEITKTYKSGAEDVQALKGVSIDFRSSEFVSILGQSGCGKTTLLNIIGGLDHATTGDLVIDGVSTRKYRDRDWDSYRNHSIGFVFQSYYLIPHQNVLKNVELSLTLSGVSAKERRQRALDALEMVGLKDQARKKPNQMSGGQMQRVAIARAIVNNPDIILADEPTGALDTETSIQVMDILKRISQDKLVIMVTHNPDLAQQYSTRIIRIIDGKVTEDTAPLSEDELCAEEAKEEETKAQNSSKKNKKPSMSFKTAFSLSLKNLVAKKGRTILTAFAGSIGIIGIALIYSVSNGTNAYIAQVQEETLTSYPITLEAKYTDVGALIQAFAEEAGSIEKHENDAVYQKSAMGRLLNSFNSVEAGTNDLGAFKTALDAAIEDKDSAMHESINTVHCSYGLDPVIFTMTPEGEIIRSDSTTLFYDLLKEETGVDMAAMYGSGSSMMGSDMMSSQMASASSLWREVMPGLDGEYVSPLFESQYDVVYGRMPSSSDEVMLVVDDSNEIAELVAYAMGLKSHDEMSQAVSAAMNREHVDTALKSWSYEEVCGSTFKVVLPSDLYKFDEKRGVWTEASLEEQYGNAMELKLVGIVKRAKDSATNGSSVSGGTILYTSALTQEMVSRIEGSESAMWQKEHPDTDMFTGLKFQTGGDDLTIEEKTAWLMDYYTDLMAKMGNSAMMGSMSSMQMDETQIAAQYDRLNPKTEATFEGNMEILGCIDYSVPVSISLYTSTFAGKDNILAFISDYNKSVDESQKINYTDYVGLIMSSVTSIINAITYVLIAFVAVSLVVSSIMIAVITLISVQERTKEIGILRSLGASKRNVSTMFNAETVIIGLFSGIIGIGVTYAADLLLNAILHRLADIGGLSAYLPPRAAIILVCVSFLLTLISGIIPSRGAAKKDPVTALRTE